MDFKFSLGDPMDYYNKYCTKMSPGLDGWRQEQQCCSSWSECCFRGNTTEPLMENLGSHGPSNRRVKCSESIGRKDIEVATIAFKFPLVDLLKKLIKPYWERGNMSKDDHKMILNKAANKVIEKMGPSRIPRGKKKIANYLAAEEQKLAKLIQDYVKKYT